MALSLLGPGLNALSVIIVVVNAQADALVQLLNQ